MLLTIPNVTLPPSWVHTSTSWWVSTDPQFTAGSIVIESLEDSNNLTSIMFNIELSPDIRYYARAQVISDGHGILQPSDVTILDITDAIEVSFSNPIPSAVMTPEFTISGDPQNMDNTLFTITTSPFSTTGNGKHAATSYTFTDIHNTPAYVDLENEIDLTEYTLSNVILDPGDYIVGVSHSSSSSDVSDFGRTIITVPDLSQIVLRSEVADPVVDPGYVVTINNISGLNNMEVVLIANGQHYSKEVYHHTVNGTSLTIPVSVFNANDTYFYLLGIAVTVHGVKTARKFYSVETRDSQI